MFRYEKLVTSRTTYYGGTSTETEHVISFDSFSEFIAACHARLPKSKNAGFMGGDVNDTFTGATYEQAYRFATNGYPDGAKLMRLKLDNLDMSSHVAMPEMYFDVVGDFGFDMGLVMSGEPECALAFRDSETQFTKSKTGPVINILVNTVMSGGIPKDVIAHRGAAICSLVDALERGGKRCQIDVICAANVHAAGALFTHRFPLKNAAESLTIENVAFALCHPAIERRFNFIALDLFPKSAGWKRSMSYGGPRDVSHEGYDVYVPMLHYNSPDWQTVQTTQNWITRTLHAMGITLDTDTAE